MIKIDNSLKPADLTSKLQRFWEISGEKIHLIEKNYDDSKGSPVFTIDGKYSTRGWTEWTQGFQFGAASAVAFTEMLTRGSGPHGSRSRSGTVPRK